MLLEREGELNLLAVALCQAQAEQRGHVFTIGGEAGIGKTTLIDAFSRQQRDTARTLWGACEPLGTPRALGPLLDIAEELGGAVRGGPRHGESIHDWFAALHSALRSSNAPTVVVVEDAHWIDAGSAEGLRFLARRIARAPWLLLVTYRSEQVTTRHPLHLALANVAPDHLTRLTLARLSRAAVDQLAKDRGRVANGLYERTDGNPFLVVELLRGDGRSPTETLCEAMRGRLDALDPAARHAAELVAVMPDRAERTLIEAAEGAALTRCLDQGVLTADRSHVRYRHELARLAVENTLDEGLRRSLHAQVLAALRDTAPDEEVLPRLVHHADAARDAAAVFELAPRAAAAATRRGAHREAASFCRMALAYAHRLSPAEHAGLLDALSAAARWSGSRDEALAANARAFALWQAAGDARGQARNRQARFDILFMGFQNRAQLVASGLAEVAVELLEPFGDSADLALALASLAYVESVRAPSCEIGATGRRAIAMAERVGSVSTLGHALLRCSTYGLMQFEVADTSNLERALAIGMEQRDDELCAQAHWHLVHLSSLTFQTRLMPQRIRAAQAFCSDRGLDIYSTLLASMQGVHEVITGQYDVAAFTAADVLTRNELPLVAAIAATATLATLGIARGDPRAAEHVDALERLVEEHGNANQTRLLWVRFVVALHWHAGSDPVAVQATVGERWLALVDSRFGAWMRGLVALWLRRTNLLSGTPAGLPEVYVRQLGGDWAGAARIWEALECPYERALALVEGDAAAQRQAFAILEQLQATATLRRCRQLVASRGQRVPRGPRASTRANAPGLTQREFEVLTLLEQGLSNADISRRLFRSEKTVEHHVSAILCKLGASTRQQAAHLARRQGLLGVTDAG